MFLLFLAAAQASPPPPPVEPHRVLCLDGRQIAATEQCPPPEPIFVFFDSGKSELNRDAEAALDALAARLRSVPSIALTLVGNTDREGPAGANRAVGLQRARLVAEALRSRGLTQVIAVESRGEDAPLVPTEDGVREPQNRRVEVRIRSANPSN